MAVLERSAQQKTISSAIGMSLLGATLVYVVLLIQAATSLSDATGLRSGRLGFLNLFELTKNAGNAGVEVGVRLHFTHLGLYVLLWLVGGLLVGVLRSAKKRHNLS